MKWLPRSRHCRRLEVELAGIKADRERIRSERDQAAEDRDAFKASAETAARQFAEADAANRRLEGRNRALAERLEAVQIGAGFDRARARETADRIARLQRAVARGRAEASALRRSAEHLQQRLDDAVGLNDPRIEAGNRWQDRREDKKAVTS